MKKILIVLTLLFMASCAKEEFATRKNSDSFGTDPTQTVNSEMCSRFTYIRPPVDLLFVWDNSKSTSFISNQTKTALNNVVNDIADRFDYQVLMAPLIGSGNSETYFFSREGISPSGVTTVSRYAASNVISNFSPGSGTREGGLSRINELVKLNQLNGALRKNAHTIIVIMSNEDDNSWNTTGSNLSNNTIFSVRYRKAMAHDLLCMRGNYNGALYDQSVYTSSEQRDLGISRSTYATFNKSCSNVGSYELNSSMLRLISLAPSVDPESYSCPQISKGEKNFNYHGASDLIYNQPYENLSGSNPYPFPRSNNSYNGFGYNDNVDVCTQKTSFNNVFDHVYNSIQDAILHHKYNYWKVAEPGARIDTNSLIITKYVRGSSQAGTPILEGTSNGYTYIGERGNFATRYSPSVGEEHSGHFIRLNGNAIVEHPECLVVSYQTPQNFYGYVKLNSKPVESSITLKINGQTINKSSTNGWQLMKSGSNPAYYSNFNIKITSPTDDTPAIPVMNETGYFLKLFGNAVYSDGANVEVNFYPTGN
ncbi:hypothetical protein ABMA79_00520 [Halobacteriovorax sp. HFRX-2_2]|uniref:hypothetical protein n=1 Tax=unclassified Halobacteriovorax TaxID=2639665 RepID=UPI00371A1F41